MYNVFWTKFKILKFLNFFMNKFSTVVVKCVDPSI